MPDEKVARRSALQNIGLVMMGIGDGLTGGNTLSNYHNIQAAAQRDKMQRDLEQQKMEADMIRSGNYPVDPAVQPPGGFDQSQMFNFNGKAYYKEQKQNYVPAFTIGDNGQMIPIITPNNPPGMVPKGTKIVPTSTMQSSEDKIREAVTKSELTSAAGILPKMDQAQEAVKMLKEQYYKGVTPMDIQKGDIQGGLKARISGIGQSAMSSMGANPDLNVYKSNRGAFASLISKGGFLEAGVLTNQDIERVLKAVPDEGSTKKEAETKWKEVEGILGKARNRYEKKLSDSTGNKNNDASTNGFRTFSVGGVTYNIPEDKVDAFKKAKGLK